MILGKKKAELQTRAEHEFVATQNWHSESF